MSNTNDRMFGKRSHYLTDDPMRPEERERTNIRYVVTHVNQKGMRQMTQPMQGRNTKATQEEAQAWIDSFLYGNAEERITEVYGSQAVGTFEVRPVECHEGHNDPKTMWFD